MRSTEDEKELDKKTFGTKIREFFIKAWTFIVSIFSKISDVVSYLIKTIIIFVQKKKVQMNSIFKLFEKNGGIKGFNETNKNLIINMLTNDKLMKTVNIGNKNYIHRDVCNILSNKKLELFVNLKISADDRTKETSLEYIRNKIKTESDDQLVSDTHTTESKFKVIEDTIIKFYMNGVLLNSVSSVNKTGLNIESVFGNNAQFAKEVFDTNKIDEIAHIFTYGIPERPKVGEVKLIEYFDGSVGASDNKNVNFEKLSEFFTEYYNMSKKLFDSKDGYISKIETTLKLYKEITKKDQKLISEMNKSIIAEVNKYIDDETPEARAKISLFHRITKIVMKIKDIKSHFIRLRQQVIINIMNLYSIENKAWWALVGNGKYLKNEYKEGDDGISSYNIIKKPDITY